MAEPGWDTIRKALEMRPPHMLTDAVSAWAAVALILRQGRGGIELLFIERAHRSGDPWSGQIAFPGGRSAPGETDLIRTAIRETREEIGLELDGEAELLGELDRIRAGARLRLFDLAIAPYVFRIDQEAALELGDEVQQVHWLALADLLDPRCQSVHEYRGEGQAVSFPCLRIEPVVVWGLTYRIFKNLRELIEQVQGSV